MHGLRKGCLRILAEAGCNILELQSRSGHLTLYAFRAAIIHRQGRQTLCRRSRGREGHRAHDKAKNRAENRGLNVYPFSNVCLTVRKLLKLLVLAIPAGFEPATHGVEIRSLISEINHLAVSCTNGVAAR